MKKIIIIVLISLFIYCVYSKLYITKYYFWDDNQPIQHNKQHNKQHNSRKEGIIKSPNDLKIIFPTGDLSISQNINKNVFIKFLNKHYTHETKKTIYTETYIDYLIGKNYILFGLFKSKELIGIISGKYTTLIISNKKYKTIYVDNLCINSIYRKNNYAPLLISAIIGNMKQNNYPLAYHRSDNKKHHFKHCYETAYYYKDITLLQNDISTKLITEKHDISIKIITEKDDIDMLYNIYINHISKNKIYERVEYCTFNSYIIHPDITTLGFYKNNNLICITSYISYNINGIKEDVIDIIYIVFLDDKLKFIIIDYLLNYMKKHKKKYITLLKNNDNKYLIEKWNFNETEKTYFYLFNYSVKNNFKINEWGV